MNRDISRLDMRLLLAFVALIDERNVTRAAERVGLTQQGLSGQLSRMRDLFGDPLFVRDRGGVGPTPRALALEPTVRSALGQLAGLLAPEQFDPPSFSGTATIAATDYAMALILPPLLERILAEAPGLRLETRPADAMTMDNDIREARIDMAITVPQFTSPGLGSMHLLRERYVGVARAGHPMFQASEMSVDLFCEQTHLLVSPFRGDAAGPTDEALARIGRQRKIGLVVPGFSVVGALLEQTDLVAVLPERLTRIMRRDLVCFEPPVAVEGFDLDVFWSPRLDQDLMHGWLREAIRQSSQKLAGEDL